MGTHPRGGASRPEPTEAWRCGARRMPVPSSALGRTCTGSGERERALLFYRSSTELMAPVAARTGPGRLSVHSAAQHGLTSMDLLTGRANDPMPPLAGPRSGVSSPLHGMRLGTKGGHVPYIVPTIAVQYLQYIYIYIYVPTIYIYIYIYIYIILYLQ
jgi:hypothetical protein